MDATEREHIYIRLSLLAHLTEGRKRKGIMSKETFNHYSGKLEHFEMTEKDNKKHIKQYTCNKHTNYQHFNGISDMFYHEIKTFSAVFVLRIQTMKNL
jgi:hypothetical protein